jgi:hypothetical protein
MSDIAVREPIEGEVLNDMARMNVTWGGGNGDLPDLVPFQEGDNVLKMMAAEAIASGYIPGITSDGAVNLDDFVVDRFPAAGEVNEHRIFIRPKTPFGSKFDYDSVEMRLISDLASRECESPGQCGTTLPPCLSCRARGIIDGRGR